MHDPDRTPEIIVDHYPPSRRALRVALVTETFPPEVNGVAATVARLVHGLQQRQHEVQLVRPSQDHTDAAQSQPGFHEVLMRGLPIPKYPHLRMGVPSKRQLVQLWALRRPDVVHIATEGPLGWSALQAALHLKLPVTSDFRTNFQAYSRHYGIGWLRKPIMGYLRKFHNRCGLTLVPTEELRLQLQRAGFRDVVALPRGVDAQRFSPVWRSRALRAQWGVDDQQLVVACVGRLASEKNLGLLLKAHAQILQHRPDARLLLVGDGPMRTELQQQMPQAIFAGQRSADDLAAHYASADLFLFPSLTETFGNVTTEAMASGLPVLAFDYAGAGLIISHRDNGWLVPYGDEAAFVAAACELAADRGLRQRLGLAARDRALQQDWQDIIARFEHLLKEVIGRWPTFGSPVQRADPSTTAAPSGPTPESRSPTSWA